MKQNKVIIIAEAGVNHNGDIKIAKQLIDAAVEAQVDYIKFQTFIAENVISKNATKAEYQINTTGKDESQLEMVKKLQLSNEDHFEILNHCKQKNIKFLSTAFDLDSIDFLEKIGVPFWKIPSGEITNLPYLEKVGALNKPIILSTGMATMEEIESAVNVLEISGTNRKNITILHCNTEYPTPMIDVNLNAMTTIADTLNLSVGYSDHTIGIEVPIAAVALGASVIEKHFTLDKKMQGPDHAASLEPDELKAMVKAIRNIELALGNGKKVPSNSEIKNIHIARKSIVAKTHIAKGEFFNNKNLTTKRPGNGISPMNWYKLIGEKANKEYFEDDLIDLQ